MGRNGIWQKDAKTICLDHETVKGWKSQSIETWLGHVRKTRQRNSDQGLKRCFDGTGDGDAIQTKRMKQLKTSSSQRFYQWQMKTHYETASQYLHSTKELAKELKKSDGK